MYLYKCDQCGIISKYEKDEIRFSKENELMGTFNCKECNYEIHTFVWHKIDVGENGHIWVRMIKNEEITTSL